MNIIIVGAGRVGYTAAEVLGHVHNLLLIEKDVEMAETSKNLLNVSVLNDDGTNPAVIKDAIRRNNTDVLISTTVQDEDNLFTCMMAKRIKPEIRTIARVRNPDYFIPTGKDGVDQIISPELIAAQKIATLALLENAVDYETLEAFGMGLATFQVGKDNEKIVGSVVIGLDIPDDVNVVAIYRGDEVITETETLELHFGDRISVLGSPDGLSKFNQLMGIPSEASEFIILGGGVTGSNTAEILESKKRYVKLIEPDTELCRKLAGTFNNVIVVNGNIVDPHVLQTENVGRADVVIAISDTDETNLLASLMAMKLGAPKIIAKYSMVEYEDIFDFTGIQTMIGYHRIVANEITKTLVSDETSLLQMKREGEMFFSVRVGPKSRLADERFGDISFPRGAKPTCIIRGEAVIYPRMDTVFKSGDKVLMFTYRTDMHKLNKLFGMKIDINV
jgi:trk system potassium uptake protein TrkA